MRSSLDRAAAVLFVVLTDQNIAGPYTSITTTLAVPDRSRAGSASGACFVRRATHRSEASEMIRTSCSERSHIYRARICEQACNFGIDLLGSVA